jgi:acid phosphatase type 7
MNSISKNRNGRLTLIVLLCLCITGMVNAQDGTDLGGPPSERPDRIVLNVTEDLSTSMSVTWRTDRSIANGFAQIAVADAHPAFVDTARTLEATSQPLDFSTLEANYHAVTFRELQPNTEYAYRVGTEGNWSEWFHFKTTGTSDEKLTFLYFGDVQTNIQSLWSRVIRQAYRTAPAARLALFGGDLVNRANRDVEWGEWFAAGGFIHAELPVMPTPGNHDHADTDEGEDLLSAFWQPQFTLPRNGPKGLEESCYYVDVQGIRFISINTQRYDVSKSDGKKQREWLQSLLADNPNRWTCVVMHHPVYSTKRNRDNMQLRKDLKPLFDEYRVDLVLQGHDHTYARGMERIPMDRGKTSSTMYVVSVSGPKMSDVLRADWMERTAGHTQLFHVIDVDGDVLTFKAFTATGELYDEFELHKTKDAANRLINNIPTHAEERN